MTKQVHIIIAGASGTGKSAIAQFIAGALSAAGFSVDWQDDDRYRPRSPEKLGDALEALREATQVTITETRLKR